MENYQGINVSSGMGQGLAQVFDAYTPQYDLGEIGIAKYKMRSAQAEADQKKQEKLDKLRDEIKTAKMPPDYLKLFEKTRTEAFDLAKQAQKTGDYEPYYKKRAEAENIAMLGSSIYDKMGSVGNVLMQHPKGVFDGVDAYDTILKGGRNITLADLYDTATSDMDALNSVRMKDKPFDVTTEYNQLQNIINPKQEGRRTFVDEAMAKDGINFAITTDPQWNKFAQAQFAAAPPQEQAKYNGDYVAWGTDNLYKPLLKEVRTPEPKGTTINNIMPSEKANPVFAAYSVQDIPLGMKAANTDYPTPFQTAVIQLPSQGVELGGGLVSTDMYRVTTSGETEQLKGQSAPTLKYTQVTSLPIATKDTEVVDTNGKKFTIKKGQVVQPNYKLAAKAINKADIPTENKLMAIAVGEDGSTYYRPAQDVAKAIVTTFSGQKGLNYKGETVLKDIDDFGNFLNSIGIDVQGYTPKQNTTKKYKSSTFKMQ